MRYMLGEPSEKSETYHDHVLKLVVSKWLIVRVKDGRHPEPLPVVTGLLAFAT